MAESEWVKPAPIQEHSYTTAEWREKVLKNPTVGTSSDPSFIDFYEVCKHVFSKYQQWLARVLRDCRGM